MYSNTSATSSSAARSICTASSGSCSTKVSSTSGWRLLKRATAGGRSDAPALGNDDSRTRPPRTPAIASSSASAAASLRDHDLGVLDERLAGVGEPHAAAAAVDERGAGALLERRDLLGDGRLGVRESVGRR